MDLSQLRFNSRDSLPPRHRRGERFLKGPIPWGWITLAAKQPGRTLHVGLAIWFWAGIKRARVIVLNLSRLSPLGLTRFCAADGLKALEVAGLVKVERRRGRPAVVTIVEVSEIKEEPKDGRAD